MVAREVCPDSGAPQVHLYEYDAQNRLVAATDPEGGLSQYTYYPNHLLHTVTQLDYAAAPLRGVAYTYDALGRLTAAAVGPNAATPWLRTEWTYSDASQALSVAKFGSDDAMSSLVSYTYDTCHRLAVVEDAAGNTFERSYDQNSNVIYTLQTDVGPGGPPVVFASDYLYDAVDRLIRYRDSESNATLYAYDSRHNMVSQIDALNHETRHYYDTLGRLTYTMHDVGGLEIGVAAQWDANGRVVARTDPNGNTTTYRYSPLDQVTRIEYADATFNTAEYDPFGNMERFTDARANVRLHQYDRLNRLVLRESTTGAGAEPMPRETFQYDALSRLTAALTGPPAAPETALAYTYDCLDNVLATAQHVDGLQFNVGRAYDPAGNLDTLTYPSNTQVGYTYAYETPNPVAVERLNRIAIGGNTLAEYAYVGGRVASRLHGNGVLSRFGYDGLGRMTSAQHGDPSPVDHRSFQWDALHNKAQRHDLLRTRTHNYAYDALSRLERSERLQDSLVTEYPLDAAGNRVGTGYEMRGLDAAVHQYSATPAHAARAHDPDGNLVGLDLLQAQLGFDAGGRLLKQAVDDVPTLFVDAFPGGALGPEWQVESGVWSAANGYLEETGAQTGRILRPCAAADGRIVFRIRSAHDPEDFDPAVEDDYEPEYYALALLRLESEEIGAEADYIALVIHPAGLFLRQWIDDQVVTLDALTGAAAVSQQDVWYTYRIEMAGSAVSVARAEGDSTDFTEVLSTTAAAVTGSDYIGFGMGERADYAIGGIRVGDAAQPGSAGPLADFECRYDAFGRLVYQNVDGAVTHFVYDGDRIVEERDGAGGLVAAYYYGLYIDEVLRMDRGGNAYYFHQDDLYSVVAVTDAAGALVERYDYGDFGLPEIYDPAGLSLDASAIGNPFLFTGRRWHPELQLYHYRTRFMDPRHGRFISRDTIGLYGDPANLGNPNAYVGNNPWTCVDPWGEQRGGFFDEVCRGIGIWLGGDDGTSPPVQPKPVKRVEPRVAPLYGYAEPGSNLNSVTGENWSRYKGSLIGGRAIILPVVVTAAEIVGEEIIFLPANLLTSGGANRVSRRAATTSGKGLIRRLLRHTDDVVEEVFIPGIGWCMRYGDDVVVDARRLDKAQLTHLRRLANAGNGVRRLPGFPANQESFRRGLKLISQMDPPSNIHAHHIFPKSMAKIFWEKFGIDVWDPRYGTWWPSPAHQRADLALRTEWLNYVELPGVTREQVLEQGRILAREYGLAVYY